MSAPTQVASIGPACPRGTLRQPRRSAPVSPARQRARFPPSTCPRSASNSQLTLQMQPLGWKPLTGGAFLILTFQFEMHTPLVLNPHGANARPGRHICDRSHEHPGPNMRPSGDDLTIARPANDSRLEVTAWGLA